VFVADIMYICYKHLVMKHYKQLPNQIVGNHNIIYLYDIAPSYYKKTKIRMAEFKCHCGKQFNTRVVDVVNNKRKSCGCKKGNKPFIYNEGDIINGIKFIRSCGTYKHAQRAIFECPICKKHWESLIGNIQAGHTKSCCKVKRGWSRSQWKRLASTAYLYKVRLYNDTETFIKIGITTRNPKKRMTYIPYNYEIIKIIEGESGYIYDLENKTKRLFKKYKYKPLINFKGETECYIF